MSKNIFEMLKYVQDTSFDTEFGVKSVNDSLLLDSKSTLTKRNSITTTPLLKDGTSHFRIIICGDSGKVHTLYIYYKK
jgi:histone acetyltransferase (RNA polymerase elongator complex component)